MARLQTYFNKFNDTIKVDYKNSKLLREKREIILQDLRIGLKRLFPTKTPTFTYFNQGSYDLGTGVLPLENEDYDIDIGLVFNISQKKELSVVVKKWVHDALNIGGRNVKYMRPCIRVQYHKKQREIFHVDLAIYSDPKKERYPHTTYYIAKGYIGSKDIDKVWEESEPFRLRELFKQKFKDAHDREQFRRVIRYLKRWKDVNLSSKGHNRPTGIAITALAFEHFTPQKFYDNKKKKYVYDDLNALYQLVQRIQNRFIFNKISVKLPVRPFNDLFEKMSKKQAEKLRNKLIGLKKSLIKVKNQEDLQFACMALQKEFGKDFPLPNIKL